MLANDKERQGLPIAVTTGGRPELKQRPNYEHDQHELVTYPTKWAEQYASEHWMLTTPYEPGSFYGAFVGREYACLEAEQRGCWGVMQLDDNITALSLLKYGTAAVETVQEQNNMVMFADVLTAITKSTKANGVAGDHNARVFHHMNAGAIRTPQTITNKTRYKQAQTYLTEQAHIFAEKRRHYAHAKVAK